VFSEKGIGGFDGVDFTQPEFLRQPSLPGAEVALAAAA
jgi:hypothetical protein